MKAKITREDILFLVPVFKRLYEYDKGHSENAWKKVLGYPKEEGKQVSLFADKP